MIDFASYKKIVNESLEDYLPKKVGEAKRLYESMGYSLLSGGKRLRGSMLLFSAGYCGLEIKDALPFACALEMIHAYSLIHDDLPVMDNDDLRRGKPTNHKVYGDAMALLAGDALLNQAFEVMAQEGAKLSGDRAACALRAIAYISKCSGASGMIAGQVADMKDFEPNEQRLLYIEENKTAKLFMAALAGGAYLAGAPEEITAAFEKYAYNYGLAFQITDDILDETGDEALIGKPIKSDEKNNKLTAVKLFGLDGARQHAVKAVNEAVFALEGMKGTKALCDLALSMADRKF
ncbi:MAG: polyprenyl synthetase family protein [Clostridiales bacterium]|nr:polyprenyl synthetase family protein [Clostridiales bacterium]